MTQIWNISEGKADSSERYRYDITNLTIILCFSACRIYIKHVRYEFPQLLLLTHPSLI